MNGEPALLRAIPASFAAWPFEPFPAAALEGSLIDRFDMIAQRYPDRLAVSDTERSLTYAGLAALVRSVAGTIAVVVDRPGPVAILLANEARYPGAMLGVLAAGHAYVPLDAHHPIERNRQIAEHSGAVAVVTAGANAAMARSIFSAAVPVLDLDSPIGNAGPAGRPRPGPDDLAYITYTSGSTGRPKGVYQNHRGLLHDILQSTETLRLSPADRMAVFHSPSLLYGTRITFGALLNGGSLHMLRPSEIGPAGIAAEIRARRITVFRSVASLFTSVAESLANGETLDSLRLVYLGGDRVGWSDVDAFRRVCATSAAFGTHLSSTECSTTYLHWLVDETLRARGGPLPLGRPLPDRAVALLGEDGAPAAVGEVGEFAVTSRYVALGYWREPELTAQAFTVDPGDPGARTYRTGDLGRLRADGLYEFVGRKDAQVKLHGHRIEPGEVEAALCRLPPVRDAAVVVRRARDGAAKALIGYVEIRSGVPALLPRHVMAMAAQVLPAVMLPAAIVIIAALPRLANLKLDRKRLGEIDATRAEAPPEASDPLIARIAAAFEAVLDSPGATPDDNLRTLGGNSLQAIALILELERRLGVAIPVGTFRASQSIRDLAGWLRPRIDKSRPGSAEHARRYGGVPVEEAGDSLGEFHPTDLEADIGALVSELSSGFAERRTIAPEQAKQASWVSALDVLFLAGRMDVLAYAARQLAEAMPGFVYAETISAFIERMPALGGGHLPFTDKRLQSVQAVARPGSETVLLLFCDRYHQIGMPVPAIHRWMGRLPASLIYLRDFRRQYFLGGIPELGGDRAATIAALRGLIDGLGGRRILCYGSSAGSFAALDYGAALGAEAVLAMAGATNLRPEFNTHLRWANSAGRIRELLPEATVDLREVYAAGTAATRLRLAYGEYDWDDRLQAELLAGLPAIELRPVTGYLGHNATMELIRRGEYEALLAWLVGE